VKVNPNALVPVPPRHLLEAFSASGGKIILLTGGSPIFRASMLLAAAHVAHGANTLAIIDGCNRFDIHLLTRFARERRLNADHLLARVYVSRGFTCYQMEAAVTAKLLPFLESVGSTKAIIFGLLDTLYDEQASFRETQNILDRMSGHFALLRERGITLFLACKEWNILPKERNAFLLQLKGAATSVFHLQVNEQQHPRLFREHPRTPTSAQPRRLTPWEGPSRHSPTSSTARSPRGRSTSGA
jgi:hypothetical protein